METPKGEISLSELLCGGNAHSLPPPTRVTSELPINLPGATLMSVDCRRPVEFGTS